MYQASSIVFFITNVKILPSSFINFNLFSFNILDELCEEVADRANYLNKRGKTVVLKIKYGDFTQITRSLSMNNPISSHNDIRTNIYNLFKNIEHNYKDIRLIGVTLSNLVNEEVTNISFFEYIKTIENNKK